MSFIYKIFLLYPYWFIKTLIHWIFQFYKNIETEPLKNHSSKW